MVVESAYREVSALLREYLEPFGMNLPIGPLRAVGEITRGIVLTGTVQLTNAARLFCHTSHQLEDAVERLSHHLSDPRWNHHPWAAEILAEQARQVGPDDLIPIDGTELAKPYARKMEHLCTVRDASRRDDPLVPGYWCWGAYCWKGSTASLAPLMLQLYSPNQPHYLSENDLWSRWCWTLQKALAGKGIWVHDRGADRPEILSAWLQLQPRWIVRVRGDRSLVGPDGSIRPAGVWADWALHHRPAKGHAVTLPVYLPRERVRQYGSPRRLWLVVPTYTFGDGDRWVLLTCGLIDQHTGPRQVRYQYALRWRSEDAKRFVGQIWHVERFLVRSFLAIERLLWCVVVAGGFLAMLQREEADLAERLEHQVVYWDKAVKLPMYRLARGVQSVAAREAPATVACNA